MKIHFETAEEFDLFESAVKSGIMYWKKVRQDAEGKICLQCNGTQTHYSVEEADEEITQFLKLLMMIEATPHEEWDGEKYVMTEDAPEVYSSMVECNKRYLRS